MATVPQEPAPVEPVPAEPEVQAEPEALPQTAVALAGKAKDLVAIRDTVVDAAGVAAGLWFSYLFVLLYLLVATGSVTHRDLLLQSPVRLPFLNVDLPLVGFFVLGPLLFLVVHAYVLLHFVLLAGKVGIFDAELRAQITDPEMRARLRRQLPSNIFVQFLAGPRETREGIVGLFLRLIAQVSLVIGPVALLVFLQLQFLPYHHEAVSWWQRIAVIIDLALLWTLWPAIAHGKSITDAWRGVRGLTIAWLVLVSLIPILLTLSVATFPGEWLETRLSVTRPPNDEAWRFGPASLAFALRHALVAGEPDFAARKPTSLWSNRLVLPGLSVMDEAKYSSDDKLTAARETYSLRGRNLVGAVLIGATLRKVDFTAALLNGVALDDADLRDARFGCAEESRDGEPPRSCAQLVGASLKRANLTGTDMVYANLRNAVLDEAIEPGAALDHAILAGASLRRTNLRRGSLEEAFLDGAVLESVNLQHAQLLNASLQGTTFNGNGQLQGARLDRAHLLGASIQATDLQGASLTDADLQAADLAGSNLGGASLRGARLNGARLYGADLSGATLDGASLQGVTLKSVRLAAASLTGTLLWRADEAPPNGAEINYVANVQTEPRKYCVATGSHGVVSLCEWSDSDLATLRTAIEEQVPEGARRAEAHKRVAERLDPATLFDRQSQATQSWQKQVEATPSEDVFGQALAAKWIDLGCAAHAAPFIAEGMIARLDQWGEAARTAIATRFADQQECPGARGLPADAKAILAAILGTGDVAPSQGKTP